MKYRTISKALEELKIIDPNTNITQCMIRKLAKTNKINVVKSGVKTLVDIDSITDYLNGVKFTANIVVLPQ